MQPVNSDRFIAAPNNLKMFQFAGTSSELEQTLRMKDTSSFQLLTSAKIQLKGLLAKKEVRCIPCICCKCIGVCCYCCWNVLCCCTCRQKVAYSLYEVHPMGYEAIATLIRSSPNLFSLILEVQDNSLGHRKAVTLYQALKNSPLRRFQLRNTSLGVSLPPEDSFEAFQDNYSPIKYLDIQSLIQWQDVIVGRQTNSKNPASYPTHEY